VTASIIHGNTYLETLERALDQSESLRDFQHQLAARFQVLNQLGWRLLAADSVFPPRELGLS
jgi:hypothetical protein